jgi:hypothetical protein
VSQIGSVSLTGSGLTSDKLSLICRLHNRIACVFENKLLNTITILTRLEQHGGWNYIKNLQTVGIKTDPVGPNCGNEPADPQMELYKISPTPPLVGVSETCRYIRNIKANPAQRNRPDK